MGLVLDNTLDLEIMEKIAKIDKIVRRYEDLDVIIAQW